MRVYSPNTACDIVVLAAAVRMKKHNTDMNSKHAKCTLPLPNFTALDRCLESVFST
jgi:hypothetical protein